MRKPFALHISGWRRAAALVTVIVTASVAMLLGGYELGAAQQASPPPTYLLLSEYDMAPGRSINDVIQETSGWVKGFRQTGEFDWVRLYIHNYGTGLRMFIVAEPKSWQAIKNGEEKFFAARPDIFTAPFRWAGHSDQILTEIPVK